MTFSGGDPFLQPLPLADLAHRVHEAGKTVITYTGYTMDYLLAHLEEQEGWRELLRDRPPGRRTLYRIPAFSPRFISAAPPTSGF